MTSASPVESLVNHASPYALVLARRVDTDDLGETIAALAARLHAATYELLVLLREFDERSGWNNGFLSCAHWLHSTPTRTPRASGAPAWRTGIDLGASREKVRVAKALPALPRISAAMQHGRVSYAKVRALTRVATAENERSLLDLALAGTAAQVERFVRAWRRVDRVQEARDTDARHLRRELCTWVDDDGMVVIRGRLTPEVGAVVQRALEATANRLFREAAGALTGDAMAEELTPGQRRADALGLLAEAALAADLDRGIAGDRYQVVLHVEQEAVASERLGSGPARGPAHEVPARDSAGTEAGRFDGVLEVGDGALRVSAETSRRLTCDASVVTMRHDADGAVLDVSRKTRTIPPSIRRALASRDTGCRFPGCTSRRCDAHHVEHWSNGGATHLDNLVRLCRRHHRAVHEGGFAVIRGHNGVLTLLRPDGAPLRVAPAAPLDLPGGHHALPDVTATLPTWDGTRFDLAWAIDVLYRGPVVPTNLDRKEEGGCGSCGNRSVVSKELVGALPV